MLRRAAVLKRICDRWMAQNAKAATLELTGVKRFRHGLFCKKEF